MPKTKPHHQLSLDLGHAPSHAADDFIVSDANRLAFDHVMAFADWPAPWTLILGAAKSGKSHLGRIWAERTEAITAGPDDLVGLGDKPDRPVLLDDVERAGFAEEALFHFLNQSLRDSRPVLMTARAPVEDWPFATADLKSRARLATAFALDAAGDAQLSQMLIKLFADRQIAVEPRVIRYMVARMERSSAEAVALVEAADRLALDRGRPVSRAIVAEVLTARPATDDGCG